MSREEHGIYILIANPAFGSRTGHAAIAITRGDNIVRYFSMYHALLPDEVRRIPASHRLKSIQGCVVDAYVDDVVMRGQSHARTERKEKENFSVPTLIQTLPTENSCIFDYFNRGQYHYAIKLPQKLFSAFDVIEALDEIKAPHYVPWTMIAPLGKIFNAKTHNCCSAICHALSNGKRDVIQETAIHIIQSFFNVCILGFYARHSSEDSKLFYLPLLLPLMCLMQSLYQAHLYVTDLKVMAKKEGPDWETLITVYSLCMIVNALGSPFSQNLCQALFTFPGTMARSFLAIPGANKLSTLPTLFTHLPKQKIEMHSEMKLKC